ncbi:glycosyltransferase [Patescibacteria group bacterium]
MLPKISIITPTLNSERTLSEYFRCIVNQKYPKDRVEVIIIDQESEDKTISIAKRYSKKINLRIITYKVRDGPDAPRLIGFSKAKNDIVCVLDSDNYIHDSNWLKRMVLPMSEDENLVGSFTLHYEHDPKQTLFNRYVGLFGVLDSVVPYLEKNDRQKITVESWPHKSQVIKDGKGYQIVKFNNENFPTLGSNGFLVRKKYIDHNKYRPEEFFHTDILYDLIDQGLNKYAVVHTNLLHDTSASIGMLLRKRIDYMTLNHVNLHSLRRYKVFDSSKKKDIVNLVKYIFFTVTFVEPLLQSIKGYLKVRDGAWFFHPIGCWIFMIGYSYATLRNKL